MLETMDNIRITSSSDLRKPCWITGKSLSPKSKKCPVLENNHIYIRSNRMRNLHICTLPCYRDKLERSPYDFEWEQSDFTSISHYAIQK